MKTVDVFNLSPSSRRIQRNGFDMSYHNYFTCKTGMLVPSYVQELRAGDYVEITPTNFTRTQPMQTSAFTQIREYEDFYFVPYRLLWRWWPQFKSRMVGQLSSLEPTSNSSDNFPNIKVPSFDLFSFLTNGVQPLKSSDESSFTGILRLLDMLDYISLDDTKEISAPTGVNLLCNPFRALAYQHIWNDWYRNKYWTSMDINSCNIDNYGYADSITDNAVLQNIFKLRYVGWYKDRNMSVIPNAGADFAEQVNLFKNSKSSVNLTEIQSYDDFGLFDSSNNQVNSGSVTQASYGAEIATNASLIRNALALDNYYRRRAMSNQDIVDELDNLYGQKEEINSYMAERLLSFVSQINIGEVTATSSGSDGSSSSNVLGQIAGKGIGSDTGQQLRYTSKEDGILMAVHYVVPTAQYQSSVEPFNRKVSIYDYYDPDFDDLGMQGAYASDLGSDTNIDTPYKIFGYQPRYAEYKSRLNTLHNQLCSGRSLSSWASPRTYVNEPNLPDVFYVSPNSLDAIFGVTADNTSDTDQFICHYNHNVSKASDMSRLGVNFSL